jgi:hypothetical protein
MRYLRALFRSIRQWWRNRKRRHRFAGFIHLESSVDPALELKAGKLVLIGPKEKPKWLRLKCPCGCGDIIALNLMASHYPRWFVEIHEDGTLTANPSVDAKICGSHFWICRNRIKWVN